MTEEQAQLFIKEQQRTNTLLENLVAMLSVSGTESPKIHVPDHSQLNNRKSSAKKKSERLDFAKEWLIKRIPHIEPYIQ